VRGATGQFDTPRQALASKTDDYQDFQSLGGDRYGLVIAGDVRDVIQLRLNRDLWEVASHDKCVRS
jgi:hypothetical protein